MRFKNLVKYNKLKNCDCEYSYEDKMFMDYMQRGGSYSAKRDSILQANKDVPFVKRVLDPSLNEGKSIILEGQKEPSSHFMTVSSDDNGHYVHPTVFDTGKDRFEYISNDDFKAFDRAKKDNNTVRFDNIEDAIEFSKNYKTEAFNNYKFQEGGKKDLDLKKKTTLNIPSVKSEVTPQERQILDYIGQFESGGGDYNILYSGYKGKTKKDLTKMTVDEVLALQDKMKASGSSAVGAHQFIQESLKDELKKAKIQGSVLFTPDLQDKLMLNRLKRKRGLGKFLSGELSTKDFSKSLSKEFASLPNPETGRSYYDKDGLNKSLTTTKDLTNTLNKIAGRQPMVQKKYPNIDIDDIYNINETTLPQNLDPNYARRSYTNGSKLMDKSFLDVKPQEVVKDRIQNYKYQQGGELGIPKHQKGDESSWLDETLGDLKGTMLNPYNWGVEDFSDSATRDKAYEKAKRNSLDEFIYRGKRYSTDFAGTPNQEAKMYHNKTIDDSVIVNKYDPITSKYLPGHIEAFGNEDAVGVVDTGSGYMHSDKVVDDLDKLYETRDNNTLQDYEAFKNNKGDFDKLVGESRAVFLTEEGTEAFNKKVKSIESSVNDAISNLKGDNLKRMKTLRSKLQKGSIDIKEFKSRVKDLPKPDDIKKGDWNLITNNCADSVAEALDVEKDKTFGITFPSNVMEKIKDKYPNVDLTNRNRADYRAMAIEANNNSTENPKKVLDNADNLMYIFSDEDPGFVNKDLKEIVNQSIQRSLTEYGYKLPKSTKGDGQTFDGVIGSETKKALEEYKLNSKNNFQNGGQLGIPKHQRGITFKSDVSDYGKNINPDFINLIQDLYNPNSGLDLSKVGLSQAEMEALRNLQITSGRRTQKENDSLKGSVKNSRHITGNAIDLSYTDDTWNAFNKLKTKGILSNYGVNLLNDYKHGTANHLHLSSNRDWEGGQGQPQAQAYSPTITKEMLNKINSVLGTDPNYIKRVYGVTQSAPGRGVIPTNMRPTEESVSEDSAKQAQIQEANARQRLLMKQQERQFLSEITQLGSVERVKQVENQVQKQQQQQIASTPPIQYQPNNVDITISQPMAELGGQNRYYSPKELLEILKKR